MNLVDMKFKWTFFFCLTLLLIGCQSNEVDKLKAGLQELAATLSIVMRGKHIVLQEGNGMIYEYNIII